MLTIGLMHVWNSIIMHLTFSKVQKVKRRNFSPHVCCRVVLEPGSRKMLKPERNLASLIAFGIIKFSILNTVFGIAIFLQTAAWAIAVIPRYALLQIQIFFWQALINNHTPILGNRSLHKKTCYSVLTIHQIIFLMTLYHLL